MSLEILIIRLSALGDVIHTLPVAAAIKRYLPDAKITWVVEDLAAPLLRNNPAVDNVIMFPGKSMLPGSVASPNIVASFELLRQFFRQFKSRRYDVAIDAQGLLKSALICWLSGANIRIGFAKTREWSDKFLTHPVDVGNYFGSDMHIVDLNLKLVIKLFEILGSNVPSSWINAQFPLPVVPPLIKERVQDWLLSSEQPKQRLQNIVLIPGTTWTTKIWPIEKWQMLAKLLLENNNCRLIICGGKSDSSPNKRLEKQLLPDNVINLTGRTNLIDLVALFEQAQLVVGADSGPMHLACAIGKPKVVAIHGSTPWKRNGPYGKLGHAIALGLECQPCFEKICLLGTLACLKDLSPEQVYREINLFLENDL